MVFVEILVCEKKMSNVRLALEKKLKLKFEIHESDYWGIYYLCKKVAGMDSIKIMNNFVDGDWQQPDFQNCPIIIYLNNVHDNDNILKEIIAGFDMAEKVYIYEKVKEDYNRKYIFENGKRILVEEKKC